MHKKYRNWFKNFYIGLQVMWVAIFVLFALIDRRMDSWIFVLGGVGAALVTSTFVMSLFLTAVWILTEYIPRGPGGGHRVREKTSKQEEVVARVPQAV